MKYIKLFEDSAWSPMEEDQEKKRHLEEFDVPDEVLSELKYLGLSLNDLFVHSKRPIWQKNQIVKTWRNEVFLPDVKARLRAKQAEEEEQEGHDDTDHGPTHDPNQLSLFEEGDERIGTCKHCQADNVDLNTHKCTRPYPRAYHLVNRTKPVHMIPRFRDGDEERDYRDER
jgi:hypothetical protein